MRYILLIFFLFSYVSYAQQVIEKCPENRDTYTYFTQAFGNTIQTYNWKVNYNGIITYYHTQTIELNFEDVGFCHLEVSVEDELTCQSAIQKYDIAIINCKQTTFYLPNTFTPNGDGINDIFGPRGENFTEFEMLIYNRWGELIFQTNNIDGWDGGTSGYYVPEGVYGYIVTYKDVKNKPNIKIGSVNIIR